MRFPLLHDLDRIFKFGIRLRRKTHDNVGGERHPRDKDAGLVDQGQEFFLRVGAVHGIQDAVITGLQRDVDLFTYLWISCH